MLIGEIEVLKRLYRQVVIPDAVSSELSHESAPTVVRKRALRVPEWIKVKPTPSVDSGLLQLDFGEAPAIALAGLEGSVLLLIDESAGRREASRRGILTTGALGVLRRASIEGLVDLRIALSRLSATNFRISRSLILDLLAEDDTRKQRPYKEN